MFFFLLRIETEKKMYFKKQYQTQPKYFIHGAGRICNWNDKSIKFYLKPQPYHKRTKKHMWQNWWDVVLYPRPNNVL